jgi:hypothetical protein
MEEVAEALREYRGGGRICIYAGGFSGDGLIALMQCTAIVSPDVSLDDVYYITSREFTVAEIGWKDTVYPVICLGCFPIESIPGVYYLGPPVHRTFSANYVRDNATLSWMLSDIVPKNQGIVIHGAILRIVEVIERELYSDSMDKVWGLLLTEVSDVLVEFMRGCTFGQMIEMICVKDLAIMICDDTWLKITDILRFNIDAEAYIAYEDSLSDDR